MNNMNLRVKTTLYEFKKGLDPIDSMRLNALGQIEEFMEENSNEHKRYWIGEILKNEFGLSDETVEKYVTTLIKYDEYTESIDQEEIEQMYDKNIDWIPYVELPDPNFSYEKLDNNIFKLHFSDWEDFSEYFITSRDIDSDTIKSILNGEAFDNFYNNYDEYDLRNYIDEFKKISNSNNFLYLKERILDMDPSVNIDQDFDKLIIEIDNNPNLKSAKNLLLHVISEAQAIADVNEAINSVKNMITEKYNLYDVEYDNERQIYRCKIDVQSLQDLSYTMFTGNNSIEFDEPYYGFYGSIDVETLNDVFEGRIDQIDSY